MTDDNSRLAAMSGKTEQETQDTLEQQALLASTNRVMMQLLSGHWYTQALYVVARLGIADLVRDGPRSVDDLAEEARADPTALYRLLRALAALGIFVEEDGRRFSQNDLSERLRDDVPGSLRPTALYGGDPAFWKTWGGLYDSIRSGRSTFELVHGRHLFDFLDDHPESSRMFQRMMASVPLWNTAIAEAYDFSDVRLAVDVGGGEGALLGAILEANPRMRGIVLERPGVVRVASEKPHHPRCTFEPGDFFESVPEGADIYVLRSILHDWPDEPAVQILRRCRSAMRPDSRLLVIDFLLGAGPFSPSPMLDLTLFVLSDGKERSQEEYAALMEQADLRLNRVLPTAGGPWILEAHPRRVSETR